MTSPSDWFNSLEGSLKQSAAIAIPMATEAQREEMMSVSGTPPKPPRKVMSKQSAKQTKDVNMEMRELHVRGELTPTTILRSCSTSGGRADCGATTVGDYLLDRWLKSQKF